MLESDALRYKKFILDTSGESKKMHGLWQMLWHMPEL